MDARVTNRILVARGLRAFADGYVSLLLPLYLLDLGYSPLQIGVLATATLLGSGVLTLLVGVRGHRYQYRSVLLAATLLMTATGIGFATLTQFWPLLLIAIVGTLNPSSGDVSVFLPLEHAMLSRSVTDRERTATFARYSLVGSLLGATGSLVAGTPSLLPELLGVSMTNSLRFMFVLYAALGLVTALLYRGLPSAASDGVSAPAAPLTKSKKHVYMLAALFSLDAFGGGFVVQSMVALWLYQRFSLSSATVGVIFFWTGVLAALSFLAAVRIAKRIGLVNTMVFTHIPSSLCLIAIPFIPQPGYVIVLLFIRSALSQMDVPTRSSYVMAIVSPEERPAAASITSVPRSIAAAASPSLAGYMLGLSVFGWPLIAAGAVKIVYDLLLLAMFTKVRPPEEHSGPAASTAPATRQSVGA
ncbi:MAG TPA: MFS transporter [Burkholderiaceae bacterium]|nr:MFS transporter [Burkholderiaceae bacterium]